MCEFISQNYTSFSWNSPLTLCFRNMRRATLDRIGAYADKGNIISTKRERSFLRNFFLICEIILQCYSLDLRKQFANTLFVETVKWYSGAHWGPLWKKKYPHIITREKLSERLLSDVWHHHTELNPSLPRQFANTVVMDSAKWYLGAHWGPLGKRKYPLIITREKLSERLLSDVWLHHTEFHTSLLGTVCKHCCRGFYKVIFGSP